MLSHISLFISGCLHRGPNGGRLTSSFNIPEMTTFVYRETPHFMRVAQVFAFYRKTKTNNEDAFHYTSTLKGRQIRLMYIECYSGLDLHTSPLSVKLVEENLDTADFDALSYVWGDQTTRMHMKCNGKNVTIGQSLHDAMMEYRLRLRRGRGLIGDRIRGLWADAICINQSNETEKTEQIRMMRDIYKAAKYTII